MIVMLKIVADQVQWGLDRDLIVKVLCGVVRPRIEFDARIYGSGRKTPINNLIPPFNRVFGQATGFYSNFLTTYFIEQPVFHL